MILVNLIDRWDRDERIRRIRTRTPLTDTVMLIAETPTRRHGAAHITRITLLSLLTGLTRPEQGTPTRSTDVSPPLKPLREWQRAWRKWLQVGGMGAFYCRVKINSSEFAA